MAGGGTGASYVRKANAGNIEKMTESGKGAKKWGGGGGHKTGV